MTGRGRVEAGQATAEMALALPVIVLVALALVQVGLVVRDQVLVVHAAREAAREAAVTDDPAAPVAAGLRASSLKRTMLTVEVSGRRVRGGRITARVSYRAVTDVPLVGPLVPDLKLQAVATMRVEAHEAWPPDSGEKNLAGTAS